VKLYRTFSIEKSDNTTVFHDGLSKLEDAIAYATMYDDTRSCNEVWVEEENWPSLTIWGYRWHRAIGSHEGFGVNFQNKHGIHIDSSHPVWPQRAVARAMAEGFVEALPPCSEFLTIASPWHSGNYRCEVVVRSQYLLPLSLRARDGTFGGQLQEEIARFALPTWLDRVDRTCNGPTTLPWQFFSEVDKYTEDFIQKNQASVFCLTCKKTVTHIQTSKRNEDYSYNRGEWTSSWQCPEGHDLYSEDHEVRLLRRPR
jgi:hypothetical protein